MRTRVTILLPAVALATALTACGGGPSKSGLVAKADGACTAGNAAIAAVAKPASASQVGAAAGTAAGTIDSQVTALRALKTPGGSDKLQFTGVVNSIADVAGPAKALQDAAGKNDEPAMAKAAVDLRAKADTAATQGQAFGLTQCGTGLKPAVDPVFEGAKSVVKGSYMTKAEGLCRAAYAKIDALAQPGSSLTSLGKYLDGVLTISNKLAADIKALPAPPGDQASIDEFNAAFDTFNGKFKDMTAAAKANNPKLFAGLSSEVDVASTALNAKFDAYGLKVCGTAGA